MFDWTAYSLSFRKWISSLVRKFKPVSFGLQVVGTAVSVAYLMYWLADTPPVGYAVLMLCLVAAVMSIRGEMGHFEKTFWMVLVFLFVFVESRSIQEDRIEHDNMVAQERREQNDRFSKIIEGLKDAMKQDQTHFEATLKAHQETQSENAKRFDGLLARGEQLVQSLSGRLVPANDPMPLHVCGPIPKGAVLVFLGDRNNAALVQNFPHTIITSRSQGPIISINRHGRFIAVLLEIKGQDGRIIARLNENGWLVNRNNYLEMRKDRSSLVITDEYGIEVLNVRYLNPSALQVKGIVQGVNIDFPLVLTNICIKTTSASRIIIP